MKPSASEVEEARLAGERLPAAPGRDETPFERLDRNLEELMAGLRVALPGVQVLFAFLLVLPFQQRFESVTAFQEDVYFATLLCTAAASILLIAPSARHRVQFRRGDKAYIVLTANRLAIAGLVFLGLAIAGAILLISDYLFSTGVAVTSTAAVGVALLWAWFASPLMRRLRRG
jgi:Family of unknown function (DUF6328)